MEYFDIIAIMLLIIVISVIIGFNIVNVVSNKISDVQINIPPFPKPNVIVNINQKDLDKYKISVSEQISNNVNDNNKINNSGVETFEGDLNNKKKIITNIKTQKYQANLENPDDRDVVNYGDYICNKKINNIIPQEKIQQNPKSNDNTQQTIPKCNKKINNTGNKKIKSNQICGNNQLNNNPENYYKIYRAFPANINDPILKGYNISNFSTAAGIRDIGKIKLDNDFKYAKPNNYVF